MGIEKWGREISFAALGSYKQTCSSKRIMRQDTRGAKTTKVAVKRNNKIWNKRYIVEQ